jgi:AcrR family transcriptional regulator
MFEEHGCHHATVDTLADALNITKQTVYYYFESKKDLLAEIVRRLQEDTIKLFEKAQRLEGTGIEKLRAALLGYAELATSDFGRCQHIVLRADLDPETRRESDRRIRDAERSVMSLIEAGISDGSIRPVNVRVLYFTIFGALNSLAVWFKPDGRLSVQEVANIQVGILLRGIAGPAAPTSALESPIGGVMSPADRPSN